MSAPIAAANAPIVAAAPGVAAPNPAAAAAAAAAAAGASNFASPYASASLYVGDLHTDVAESQLFEVFNCVGPVASIRVCRDVATRRSLGYAYVNFHNVQDADRALDQMNNTPIKGKPCRIMWSQRDPSVRKSGLGNVFIKNLAKNIDHKILYDTFAQFGNILSCKVAMDDQNRSRGYGFVHFETGESADKAVAKVNGMMLNGQKVFVGPFVPRKERIQPNDANRFTNVYVKNLDESITTDKLKEMFEEFGKVSSAVVQEVDGKSKGFGFVNFDDHESAAKAVDEINAREPVEGVKKMTCCRAQKKSEREEELRRKFEQLRLERLQKYQGVNLYVKNLDDDITDDRLKQEFASFGAITSAKIMRDDKANSKGFGFVCFSNPEEATRAANEMNGKMLQSKPLYVALAQRKEVRRAQLEAQHAARQKGRLPQANGLAPTPGMYPGGAPPVYYPPQPQGFVYPQQMVPRNRWAAAPPNQAAFHNMGPGYMMTGPMQRQNPGQQGHQQQRGARVAGRGGRGGYRGQRQGDQAVGVQQAMPVAAAQPPKPENLASKIAALPQADQMNAVGEALFPLVAEVAGDNAGKITGMLLDRYSSGFDELANIMENTEQLNAKIAEAQDVLRQHVASTEGADK